MRDFGPSIAKNRASGLAKAMQKDFLGTWVIENQGNFVEVMEMIREGNPVKYAELYLKAVQMGLIRETNVNININRQQDYDELQALVRTRVQLPQKDNYADFVEVNESYSSDAPESQAKYQQNGLLP